MNYSEVIGQHFSKWLHIYSVSQGNTPSYIHERQSRFAQVTYLQIH